MNMGTRKMRCESVIVIWRALEGFCGGFDVRGEEEELAAQAMELGLQAALARLLGEGWLAQRINTCLASGRSFRAPDDLSESPVVQGRMLDSETLVR